MTGGPTVAHEPTQRNRDEVEALAGFGNTNEQIGKVLRIHPDTLRKYYFEELERGHLVATNAVARNLFKIATGSGRAAVTAAIFWMKCRAGWKETTVHEYSGGLTLETGATYVQSLERKLLAFTPEGTPEVPEKPH